MVLKAGMSKKKAVASGESLLLLHFRAKRRRASKYIYTKRKT
jgi:hypothetical protein